MRAIPREEGEILHAASETEGWVAVGMLRGGEDWEEGEGVAARKDGRRWPSSSYREGSQCDCAVHLLLR